MSASRELTEQQSAFAVEYVACGNAAEAARLAGYCDSGGARQAGHRLLCKPHVAREIRRLSLALADSHLPDAVAVLAVIMKDIAVEPRDRVRAAEALLRLAKPASGPGVAVQVNVGRGAEGQTAQSLIREIWASRSQRIADQGLPDDVQLLEGVAIGADETYRG